ncbi:hypothetical protein BDN67DRAFT_691110 [Paxillus ammoniavirescens]|nr:hypothetical protein BDN67DRAFT_691110 [Paxillus ammoniavirescens]
MYPRSSQVSCFVTDFIFLSALAYPSTLVLLTIPCSLQRCVRSRSILMNENDAILMNQRKTCGVSGAFRRYVTLPRSIFACVVRPCWTCYHSRCARRCHVMWQVHSSRMNPRASCLHSPVSRVSIRIGSRN